MSKLQLEIQTLKKLITHFEFPVWCLCCKKFIATHTKSPSIYLCSTCYYKLPFSEKALCGRCGLKHSTHSCRSKWAENITRFDAIFDYQKPVSDWIGNLKYFKNLFAGRLLQLFVADWFNRHPTTLKSLDYVLPVPLHISRLHWRSFNQALFLINKQHQLPVNIDLLRRIRRTPHQAGLDKFKRGKNMKNAFRIEGNIENKSILIFDDVCTTGTTIGEICQVLKANGVKKIHVLTLARVI